MNLFEDGTVEVLGLALPARFLFALIPYAGILFGLHILHSAWVALLSYHLGIVLVLTCAGPGPPRARIVRVARRLRSGWSGRAAALAILVCAGTGPAFLLLWPVVSLDPGGLAASLDRLGLSGASLHVFSLWYCTAHPVLEEAFWRDRLGSADRRPEASDLLFAGYHMLVLPTFLHLPWVLASFVILAGAAWFWRTLTLRHAGLAVTALSHAVASISTMAAVYWLSRK